MFNILRPVAITTLKSTVLAHFTTLCKLQSINTPSGQLVKEATEYINSAQTQSVKNSPIKHGNTEKGK
jgi:hypothetical protein